MVPFIILWRPFVMIWWPVCDINYSHCLEVESSVILWWVVIWVLFTWWYDIRVYSNPIPMILFVWPTVLAEGSDDLDDDITILMEDIFYSYIQRSTVTNYRWYSVIHCTTAYLRYCWEKVFLEEKWWGGGTVIIWGSMEEDDWWWNAIVHCYCSVERMRAVDDDITTDTYRWYHWYSILLWYSFDLFLWCLPSYWYHCSVIFDTEVWWLWPSVNYIVPLYVDDDLMYFSIVDSSGLIFC